MPVPGATIPTPTILVDGTVVQQNVDLGHLTVTQTIGAAAHAHLRFDNAELAVTKYKVGSKLVVKAPDAQRTPVVLFSGVIVSVGLDWRAGRAELLVDAYDASHKLAQQTVIKNYIDQTPADIISAIAGANGLTADVSGKGCNVTYPFVQQHGTPHQLITELAHTAGCEWWMDDTKIVVRPRKGAGGPAVTLSGLDTLRRFNARFSGMDRTAKVNVRGWDPKTKKDVVATATGIVNGAPSTPSIADSGDKPSGEATSWPRRVVNVSDASAIAEGIAGRMGAALLSARGEADLSPKIRPGVVVTIEQVNTAWNGNYYITEAEHTFGRDQPFMTRFVAGASDDESIGGLIGRQNQHNGARFTDGLTIGIVTNNKDDEKMNRVKVRFPYLADQGDSAWARLVSPGAGSARGLMVIPEIDDEVLVGFENGDIRRPYVLGGLWNGKDAPPMDATAAVSSNKVATRSFTTRLGHHLSFVDKGGNDDMITVALKGDKATLVLGGDKITLLHADDVPLTVKTSAASFEIAKGGDITMKGKNITIEAQSTVTLKGTDVKIDAKAGIDAKANAKVSVKGTGGVDVDGSPGLATVKGSMVQIN